MKIVLYLLLIVVYASCTGNEQKHEAANGSTKNIIEQRPLSAMISADTAKLSKIIDLKTFPPQSAAFKYTGADLALLPADTAEINKEDYALEAVLSYDEKTYGAILTKYMDAGFPKAKYSRNDFDFSWLDADVRQELQSSNTDYFGNPDIFLGTNGKAKLWFLDKKILVKLKNP